MKRAILGGALAAGVLLAGASSAGQPVAGAQVAAAPSLSASVRDGRMVVEGRGFPPGERVTVRVQTRGRSAEDARVLEVEAVADAAGSFAVPTDVAVPPVTGADFFVMYSCSTPVPVPTATPAASTAGTPAPGGAPAPRTVTATACGRVLAAGVAFSQAAPLALPRTGGGGEGWRLAPWVLAGAGAGVAGAAGVTGVAGWGRRRGGGDA